MNVDFELGDLERNHGIEIVKPKIMYSTFDQTVLEIHKIVKRLGFTFRDTIELEEVSLVISVINDLTSDSANELVLISNGIKSKQFALKLDPELLVEVPKMSSIRTETEPTLKESLDAFHDVPNPKGVNIRSVDDNTPEFNVDIPDLEQITDGGVG